MHSGTPQKKFRKVLPPVLLLVLLLAGSGCWILLRNGIALDHFATASMDAYRLSLRLEKGLNLQIDLLQVHPASGGTEGDNFPQKISRLLNWESLFNTVTINRIIYQDHIAALAYRDGEIRIEGTGFNLAGSITEEADNLSFVLSRLELKKSRLQLQGSGLIKPGIDTFTFSGEFQGAWGKGTLEAKGKRDAADVIVRTGPFTELGPVLEQLHLDPEARDWVVRNITADEYRIEQLHLRVNPYRLTSINPEDITGRAVARSAAIRFHQGLPPVTCDKILISYKDDRLSFDLINPVYQDNNLEGSNVVFTPLLGSGTEMAVHIRTQSSVDRDILKILDAYGITLPFRQKSGTTQTDLTLTFALPEFDLTSTGTFQTQGQWLWAEHVLQVQEAALKLDNKTVQIEGAEISSGDTLKTGLSGSVDLEAKKAVLTLDIEKLLYRAEGTILLEASDKSLPVNIDYAGTSVVFMFDELQTVLRNDPESIKIDISSIAALRPFMPLLRNYPVTTGRLQALARDTSHIRFDGELEIPNQLFSLEGKPVSRFRFRGKRNGDRTNISVNNGRITAVLTDTLAVELKDYLVTIAAKTLQNAKISSPPLPLDISGPAALINTGELRIPTQAFNLKISGDDLKFKAKMAQGDLTFTSLNGQREFTGRDLDAALIDDFFPSMDMSDGRIDAVLQGKADDFEGYLDLRNIHVENTKILHNLLAFINTVPALATFSSPGFDSEGYLIQEGIIHFSYHDPIVKIQQMHTDGTTVNIELQGWINLKERTLDLDAELITLKDYSKIISKIPLAGYALLDEDGSLSTSLEITGSLDAPDIKTNLARDILFTPLNVIKRTIQWPFRILNKAVNGVKDLSGPEQPGPDNPPAATTP